MTFLNLDTAILINNLSTYSTLDFTLMSDQKSENLKVDHKAKSCEDRLIAPAIEFESPIISGFFFV